MVVSENSVSACCLTCPSAAIVAQRMPVFVQIWAGPFGVASEWHFAWQELFLLVIGYWVWASPGGSSIVVDLLGKVVRYLLDWG